MIRSFADEDVPRLVAVHNRVYPEMVYSEDGFRKLMEGTLASGGLAWVVEEALLSGYAMIVPDPGLHGVGDLKGCIVPERRRCGLGSKLLGSVLEDLQETDFRKIEHCLADLNSPAAHFFRTHNFFVGHEEWVLELDCMEGIAGVHGDNLTRLQTFSRETAVSLFCRLYEESFSGLPWSQPFTTEEAAETLSDAEDLLFLTLSGETIGFAWIGVDGDGKGLIEPLGIVTAYQHKGFGRLLLLGVLRELISRGAQRVEIGAWRNNHAAIQLYQSLGFRHIKTFTYLAFNLKDDVM